jgi:hypothetical protein
MPADENRGRWRMAYSQKKSPAFSKPLEVDSENAIMVDEVGHRGIVNRLPMTDDLPMTNS